MPEIEDIEASALSEVFVPTGLSLESSALSAFAVMAALSSSCLSIVFAPPEAYMETFYPDIIGVYDPVPEAPLVSGPGRQPGSGDPYPERTLPIFDGGYIAQVAKDLTFPSSVYTIPQEEVSVTLFGQEVSGNCASLSVSGGRNQPVGGTMKLWDVDGGLIEKLSQWRQTNANVRAHAMDMNRVLEVSITQGGSASNYPTLIPLDPVWPGDGSVDIPFSDPTPVANLDNQTITDVLSDEGDDKTAHEVIAELATKTSLQIHSAFQDYDVRTFRFSQQNLLAGIDEILQVRQAYRKFVGSTMVLESLQEGPATAQLIDRVHLTSLSATYDTSALKTLFNAYRLNPMPTALSSPISGNVVGRTVRVDLVEPSAYVVIVAEAVKGVIEDGVFFDENDQPLNNRPSNIHRGSPSTKASYWVATYRPQFSDEEFIPYWRAFAMGGGTQPTEDGFNVSKSIAVASGLYGSRPEFRNLQTELVRDSSTMAQMLDAIELEVLYSVKRYKAESPYLLPTREGGFVDTVCWIHGLSSPLLLNSWSHSWTPENGLSCSYDLRGKL